jgi:hypothetical protein
MATTADLRNVLQALMKKEFKNVKEDDIFIGSVVKIFDEVGSEYYGTVHVQPADDSPILYNVRVNAVMEGANRGKFTFPKLYSDVIGVKYQKDLDAVILLFSHIEKVEYIIDKEIIHKVQKVTTPDPELYDTVTEEVEFTHIRQTTTDIELKANVIKAGNNMSGIFEPMVLGDTLTSLLNDLVNILKAAKVSTSIGPQPFLPDTLVKLEQLAAGVNDIKSQVCKLQ